MAPLVFELKKLGVFHPCWSCEGHAIVIGKLRKMPRVWFYADFGRPYPRSWPKRWERLGNARRLSSRWQIVVTHSDADNPDTTFSLQPEPAPETSLGSLQGDLRALADELGRPFWHESDALAAQAR